MSDANSHRYLDKPDEYLCGCPVIETSSLTGAHRPRCPEHDAAPDWESFYDRYDSDTDPQ